MNDSADFLPPDPPLSSAERKQLRGMGMALKPSVFVGKGGLAPAVIAEADTQLMRTRLIKVRFASTDRIERASLGEALAEATGADLVGQSGKTALLHRLSSADSTDGAF